MTAPVHGRLRRGARPDFSMLPRRGGSPLPARVRGLLQRTTGHPPPDGVMVHTDAASRSAADAYGVRALTYGRQIRIGSAGSALDTGLLVHEATHAARQHPGAPSRHPSAAEPAGPAEQEAALVSTAARAGLVAPVRSGREGDVVHRAVIDDVREKLSYGVLDWAITDSEAMEAMALLSTIAPALLAQQLQLLGDDFVARLLDNLPDAAKTGAAYQRVVEAASRTSVVTHAADLLSYGPLDLVVTDTEVSAFFNLFTTRPQAQQEQLLTDLADRGKLGRLFDNANPGHHALYIRPWLQTLTRGRLTPAQETILGTLVRQDIPIETMTLAAEIRFDVTIGPTTQALPKADWDVKSLRSTYLALERLPAAHVAGNLSLKGFGHFDSDSALQGRFSKGLAEVAVNRRAVNTERTVLHETGHAVDEQMGWSLSGEPAKPQRGGWKRYDKPYDPCASDMVVDSGGGVQNQLTAPQKGDVVTTMADAMDKKNAAGLQPAVKALPWFATLTGPQRRAVLADDVFHAVSVGLNEPWENHPDGGTPLGPHYYQDTNYGYWTRYRHEARRPPRFIRNYQFRTCGEWFADAYRVYYTPDNRGLGAKLNDHDPDTKAYFDATVHTFPSSR